MSATSAEQRREIPLDLDIELGGKPLTQEVIESLGEEQITLLGAIGEKNDEMIKACEETRGAGEVLTLPDSGLGNGFERDTVAAVITDVAPIKLVKINGEMQVLLRQAVDGNLGTLALVQRMCQRYGLSDYIRGRLSDSGAHTTRA